MALRHIDEAVNDPTEMKQRIMAPYEAGLIDAEEAEEWIVLRGLAEA